MNIIAVLNNEIQNKKQCISTNHINNFAIEFTTKIGKTAKLFMGLCVVICTVSCSSNANIMKNAVVGYVDGNPRPLVMFPIIEGKTYRPQFTSECPVNYYYDDNNSSTCVIRIERIINLHSYREHVPTKYRSVNNHILNGR
ncbi:hypothetical protein ACSPON_000307 [Klebsiella aerogenes]